MVRVVGAWGGNNGVGAAVVAHRRVDNLYYYSVITTKFSVLVLDMPLAL